MQDATDVAQQVGLHRQALVVEVGVGESAYVFAAVGQDFKPDERVDREPGLAHRRRPKIHRDRLGYEHSAWTKTVDQVIWDALHQPTVGMGDIQDGDTASLQIQEDVGYHASLARDVRVDHR